jgi:hypothetical protein
MLMPITAMMLAYMPTSVMKASLPWQDLGIGGGDAGEGV